MSNVRVARGRTGAVSCTAVALLALVSLRKAWSLRTSAAPRYVFPLPAEVHSVIIDIGLYDSIVQPKEGEFVIAIDASLREIEKFQLSTMCQSLGSCLLINAAIGIDRNPFVNLQQSNREGGSSHITNYDPTVWPMELSPAVVPVFSLQTVIDSIPPTVNIDLCKTDTNGNDVYVIESAGATLQRCRHLVIEIVGPRDGTGPPDQYERAIRITQRLGFQFDPNYPSDRHDSGSYNLFFMHASAKGRSETHHILT